MAPTPITDDYYLVLEVEQTATPELVNRSYKRLALKLHPDRNAKHDTTKAFQLLGNAYETLKDENKRRAYDLIYPAIRRSCPSPQTTTPQPGALSEATQIVALQKSKQERGVRWGTKKNAFDSSIFELQRDIQRLKQEIKNLDSILAAEAAEDAQRNSWGTWLLSPIYKRAEDSEEEKAQKDRKRQERRIEKDMKERRLGLKRSDLNKEESMLRKAKEEVDAADLVDNGKIRVLQFRIQTRETRERQEKERVERERRARVWKQQQEQREKQQREAAEALRKQQAQQREAVEASRKQQAQERATEQKRREEQARKWQKIIDDNTKNGREQYAHLNPHECFFTAEGSTRQASTSTCRHGGWWPKVQGRTACPECSEIWTYLLQCPGCKLKACPRCQGAIRPRISRNAARTNRGVPPRTPSQQWFNDDY